MTEPSNRPPSPLRGEHELGALLREANEQYAAGLDEASAYRRVQEQLTSRHARGSTRFGARRTTAFLGGLALAGALVWLKASTKLDESIVFGPEEPARARSAPSPDEQALTERVPSAEEAPSEAATVSESPALAPPEPKRESVPPSRAVTPRAVKLPEAPPLEVPAPEETKTTERAEAAEAEAAEQPKAEPPAPELDCMQMARDGAPRQAESCFATLASGAGLRAEMALHEMARLRRDVLGDARGALAALSEYRQRFPRGSLRHEVALSRVELLVRLGRTRDALRESEELLTSPVGRVRAAELHVLRGNMYRTALSDLNAAAAEFARAERLGGPLGAEATYLRGTCLEALGDGRAALEAYERYLSTPRRPRAAEVRQRIAALSGSARAAP